MERIRKKVSAFTVIEIILIVILALIMITMLVFNFMFKDKNSAASLFGYSFFNTKSFEMMRDIPKNTLIIAKESEKENVKEGSVVLCRIGNSTVLMRVNSIQEEAGKTYYVVRFDYAAENEAARISSDAVIAKAVWQIDGFGNVINFASSTHGIIISVVIPLLLIIAMQVIRIISIRRLEDEASAIDDIDDLINIRDSEEPAAVTFTEPKFIEDVTGKIPQPSAEANKDTNNKEEKISPLYTYDEIMKEKEPALVGAASENRDGTPEARQKIRSAKKNSDADDFFENYSPRSEDDRQIPIKNSSVVFTPHLNNIIPDDLDEKAPEPVKRSSGFDDSVKAFFEKKYVAEEPAKPVSDNISENVGTSADVSAPDTDNEKPTVPEHTAVQAERAEQPAAPHTSSKKKRSNKALEELMGMIDAEETKLKK